MQKERIVYLLKQHRKGMLTRTEELELLELIRRDPEGSFFVEAMAEDMKGNLFQYTGDDARWREMADRIIAVDSPNATQEPVGSTGHIHFLRSWKWAAAAVVLFLAGSVRYLMINRTNKKPTIAATHYKGDVLPGHSGAVLHLSNGSTVVLDSARNGTIAMQGTIEAIKVNGELRYIGKTDEPVFNTVTTDRGRQWRLTLPDGTKVWLNAASSIRYPLTFNGPERIVEMTGEAYFEVVHNSRQPFKVQVGGQLIEDVGTAFNVNAYRDGPDVATTLLEGSVRVSSRGESREIKRGEQTVVNFSAGGIKINRDVNLENVVAWKNGFFSFQDADIQAVMHQLARWYDVDVKYQGNISKEEFNGKIGRMLSLAQVLKILEQTRVHFKIEEDKRIVILP